MVDSGHATQRRVSNAPRPKLALDEAITALDKSLKRLMQDAYYRQEAFRLL
ncbi:MAG: hypothetical protein M3021_02210 [Actinomycetota bacterium]|nr:hypothetical protein [Actinomycetota bacterium]